MRDMFACLRRFKGSIKPRNPSIEDHFFLIRSLNPNYKPPLSNSGANYSINQLHLISQSISYVGQLLHRLIMAPIIKQTARKSTGGKAPHLKLATARATRRSAAERDGDSSVQASIGSSPVGGSQLPPSAALVAAAAVIDEMDIDAFIAADPEDLPHWKAHILALINEILNGM